MTEWGGTAEKGVRALESVLEGLESDLTDVDGDFGDFWRLLAMLARDFPEICWRKGRKFAWRAPRTITIGLEELKETLATGTLSASLLILHEVGHAKCQHRGYDLDVERLKMEVEAWEAARGLAQKYGVDWDEEGVQETLDSYRDWLHKRARCRECGLTRYQGRDGVYHCPQCENLR